MVFSDDERRAFAILGIPSSATHDEVRRAYRDLVRRWHPDQYEMDTVSRDKAVRTMAMINWAYQTVGKGSEDAPDVADDWPPVVPARETIASRLTPIQIDGIVKAILNERSFAREWRDPWNRTAVWIAMIWVTLVAIVSWFGPNTGFDPVVERAVAPIGAVTLMAICVAMIRFGSGVYRFLGWAFLVFFVLLLPILRAALWAFLL